MPEPVLAITLDDPLASRQTSPRGQKPYEQTKRGWAALERPYARQLMATIDQHLDGAGEFFDFGGLTGKALLLYYERTMGHPYEPKDKEPNLPAYRGMQAVMGALAIAKPKRPSLPPGGFHRSWTGHDHEKARAMGASWLCPSCGPVTDQPLHGDDNSMHCPNLDCDAVVDAVLSKIEEYDFATGARGAKKPFHPKPSTKTPPKPTERTYNMANRKKATYADKPCETCGDDYTPGSPRQRWCSPECKPKKGKGLSKKTKATKKLKKKLKKAKAGRSPRRPTKTMSVVLQRPEPSESPLLDEAEALVRVVRALDGLSPAQCHRVLGWVADALPPA